MEEGPSRWARGVFVPYQITSLSKRLRFNGDSDKGRRRVSPLEPSFLARFPVDLPHPGGWLTQNPYPI